LILDITNPYKPEVVLYYETLQYPTLDIICLQLTRFFDNYTPELYMDSSELQFMYDQLEIFQTKQYDQGININLIKSYIMKYAQIIYQQLGKILVDRSYSLRSSQQNEIKTYQIKLEDLLLLNKSTKLYFEQNIENEAQQEILELQGRIQLYNQISIEEQ